MMFDLKASHDHAAEQVLAEMQALATRNPNVTELVELGNLASQATSAARMSPWAFLHAGAMTGAVRATDPAAAVHHARHLIEHLRGVWCQHGVARASWGTLPVVPWGHRRWASPSSWAALLTDLRSDDLFPDLLLSPGTTGYAGEVAQRLQMAHQIILATAPPRVAESVAALISEVVIAQPAAAGATRPRSFGGASTFWFRRGAVMNVHRLADLPSAVDQLAHEAAHAALFAIAQGDLLCLNDDRDTFEAPHRPDPRPMTGVIHGLAAMRWSAGALQAVPEALWPDGKQGRRRAEALAAGNAEKARGLAEIVAAHAQLTPLGGEVLEWIA